MSDAVVTRCMDCGRDWSCPDGLPGIYVCPACLTGEPDSR